MDEPLWKEYERTLIDIMENGAESLPEGALPVRPLNRNYTKEAALRLYATKIVAENLRQAYYALMNVGYEKGLTLAATALLKSQDHTDWSCAYSAFQRLGNVKKRDAAKQKLLQSHYLIFPRKIS